MAYEPKTYRKAGGDEFVVASGGLITVESGGIVEINTGGDITVNGASLIDEIAALSGLDSGELGVLNGVVAGTTTASKALVVGANKNLDTLVIADGGLYLGAGAGTSVSATAAELNFNDTALAGTSVASKTLVLGASKNTDILGLPVGGLKIGTAGAEVAVDADAAELNYLNITTLGTGAASKAVVLDAGEDYTWPPTGVLTYGGGAITATGVEINEQVLTLDIADGSADATYYMVCPHAGTISRIWTVIDGVVSTADITITPNIGATPITDGVVTIATAASAAGDIDSATPSAANVVTAGQAINLVVAGGGAGGAPRIHVAVVVTR